jgi:hypothetical protein
LKAKVDIPFKEGERMVVSTDIGAVKVRERRLTTLTLGLTQNWGVHKNNLKNLERAIVERVFMVKGEDGAFAPPAPPTTNIKRRLQAFTRRLFDTIEEVEPISTKQFVETYVGKKRRMYQHILDNLYLYPLRESDAFVNPFIKDEKTDFNLKPDKCPRIIQPRKARFNIEFGVYSKPLEKAIFRAISSIFRGVTVAKGLNCFERGELIHKKWSSLVDPVALMIDASRFDQHCHSLMLGWVHMIEEKIFPELKRLNAMRKKNRCFARTDDGNIDYTVEGKLMSGDMDTSLSACLIMSACVWTIMRELKVKEYNYINDGDDGVLFVERSQVERVRKDFQRIFKEFGYTVRIDSQADLIEEVEFCQTRPVYDGTNWRMVRDPVKALAKDALTLRRIRDSKHYQELQSSIGWCGLSLAGDLPVFNAFYKHLITQTYKPDPDYTTGMQYLAHGLAPRAGPVTDAARFSFFRAFGLSPEIQLAIEEYYLTLTPLLYDQPVPVAFHAPNTVIEELTQRI